MAHLPGHGAELVDQVVQYEDLSRLCDLRGLSSIVVAPSEQLSRRLPKLPFTQSVIRAR